MGSNLPEGRGGGAPLYKSQGTLHASRKIKIKPLRETNVMPSETKICNLHP